MRPVRIMHRCKGDASSLLDAHQSSVIHAIQQDTHSAFQRGQHHMRSIQRVNKVGWECGSLLDAIDGSGRGRVRDVNRLQGRHDLLALRLTIRLHDRQPQRRRPHHRRHLFLPCAGLHRISLGVGALGFEDLGETFFGNAFGNEFGAEIEPVLDAFGTCEEVTDAVEDILCKVGRSCPTVFFRYVSPIFQLPLDLVASPDISDAVHSRHDLEQKTNDQYPTTQVMKNAGHRPFA